MQDFINNIMLDFAAAKKMENGCPKFSELLKSLSDQRLDEYRNLVHDCLNEKDDKKVQDLISNAVFLYTYFISIFEDPGNLTIELDGGCEWLQHMQILIAVEGLRRKDVFSDVQGSLIGKTFEIKPGINFDKAKESFLASSFGLN